MTLLETVVALVILSLSAIGVLGVFQQTNRTAVDAHAWTVATAYAEEGVEASKIGPAARREIDGSRLPPGFSRRIDVRPAAHGLSDVSVTVTIPGGASMVVHRLIQP